VDVVVSIAFPIGIVLAVRQLRDRRADDARRSAVERRRRSPLVNASVLPSRA
jgi:hypothetical protein